MSDIGRVPLWMVATVGGLAALGLLSLFLGLVLLFVLAVLFSRYFFI
jgi:hypothetical protein